jgi:flagella basal body P-ring formation protein FlgA
VAEALRALLARDGARVEVDVARAPRDVVVPRGAVELKVRPLSQGAVPAKRQAVWVDIWVGGRFVRTVTVDAEVSVFRPALVASAEQRPGEVLERSRLSVREVEVSGRRAPPVDPASPEPLRVRRPLPAGATVTRADVEPAPLVTRGHLATLRGGGGLVRLETRVEVLEDGRPGQLVRVKVPNSTGPVLARVTGLGTVEVQP